MKKIILLIFAFLLVANVLSLGEIDCSYNYNDLNFPVEKCCNSLCENYEYDANNRLVKIQSSEYIIEYTYNNEGWPASETTSYPNDAFSYKKDFVYENNRLKEIREPLLTTIYTYDVDGKPVKEEKVYFDGVRKIETRDFYDYGDFEGQISCVDCEEDATGNEIELDYNSEQFNDWIRELVIEESVFSQSYNEENEIERVCELDCSGSICEEENCAGFNYGSSLHEIADEGLYGENIIYEYDNGNLVYDPVLNLNYEYDRKERIISDGVYGYEYDIQGRVSKQNLLETGELIASYSYNSFGLISKIDYADGSKDEYFYDVEGNLIKSNHDGNVLFYTNPGDLNSAITQEELTQILASPPLEKKFGLKELISIIFEWIKGKTTSFVVDDKNLDFDLGKEKQGQLKVTLEHPFLIDNKWIPASELKAGDELTTENGRKARITSIEKVLIPEGITVYNLEDAVHNNYIAGSSKDLEGIVVHNSNSPKTCPYCWENCPEGWFPGCGGFSRPVVSSVPMRLYELVNKGKPDFEGSTKDVWIIPGRTVHGIAPVYDKNIDYILLKAVSSDYPLGRDYEAMEEIKRFAPTLERYMPTVYSIDPEGMIALEKFYSASKLDFLNLRAMRMNPETSENEVRFLRNLLLGVLSDLRSIARTLYTNCNSKLHGDDLHAGNFLVFINNRGEYDNLIVLEGWYPPTWPGGIPFYTFESNPSAGRIIIKLPYRRLTLSITEENLHRIVDEYARRRGISLTEADWQVINRDIIDFISSEIQDPSGMPSAIKDTEDAIQHLNSLLQ